MLRRTFTISLASTRRLSSFFITNSTEIVSKTQKLYKLSQKMIVENWLLGFLSTIYSASSDLNRYFGANTVSDTPRAIKSSVNAPHKP